MGAHEIANVLEWIERFNAENNLMESQKLTPQICGSHMFSLLHAAIIFEKLDLVSKLLLLGADPSSKSEQGSAVVFATRLVGRAREKLQKDRAREQNQDDWDNAEGKNQEIAGSPVPLRREEQVSRLEEIAKVLQHHAQNVIHVPPPNGRSASSSPAEDSFSDTMPKASDSIKAGSQTVTSGRPQPAAPKKSSYTTLDQTGAQLQQRAVGYPPNPPMDNHRLVLAFCRTLGSHGWVLESPLSVGFYKVIGRKDKESRELARDAALREGMIEIGRTKSGKNNGDVVTCGLHLEPGFNHDRFIRLTPKGKSFLQTQQSRKAQQPPPKDDRKRKADSETDIAQLSAKRHANSVTVSALSSSNLTQFHQRPLPASAHTQPVVSETDGDTYLSPYLIPRNDRYLLLLLESTWNPEETWAENRQISLFFYEKLRTQFIRDEGAFKSSRHTASAKGLIKWGRRDLAAPGEPIVDPDNVRDKTGLSFETYLCLTSSGLAFLMSKGFDPAKEVQVRRGLSFAPESTATKAAKQRLSEMNEPGRSIPPPPAHRPTEILVHRQDLTHATTGGRPLAPQRYPVTGTATTTATAAPANDVALLPNVQDGRFWFEKNSSWPKPCAENFQRCPCRRPHVHPPLKNNLEMDVVRQKIRLAMYMEMDLPPGARVSADMDGSGLSVFTSAFFDPEMNMYVLPEGGAGGRQNGQGVFWYPTKLMAKKSLEKVWAVAKEMNLQQQQRHPHDAHRQYPPPQQRRPLAHGALHRQDPGGFDAHHQSLRHHQNDNNHAGGNYSHSQYDNRNRHDNNFYDNNRRHGRY